MEALIGSFPAFTRALSLGTQDSTKTKITCVGYPPILLFKSANKVGISHPEVYVWLLAGKSRCLLGP